MGDQHDCALSFARGLPRCEKVGHERVGGIRVEVFGGFVEQQVVRGRGEGAGEQQAPSLSARHRRRVRAQEGVDSFGKVAEPSSQPRPVEQLDRLLLRDVRAGDAEVLQDGRGEDVGVLGRQDESRGDLLARDVADFAAVQAHVS